MLQHKTHVCLFLYGGFMRYYRFMMKYLDKYRNLMWVVVACTGIHAAFNLVSPLIISFFIDYVIGHTSVPAGWETSVMHFLGGRDYLRSNLWVSAAFVMLAALIQSVNVWIRGRAIAVYSEGFAENLRNSLYAHLQRLPYGYHVKSSSGDLIQRSTSDVDQVRKFMTNQIREIVFTVVICLVSVSILFSMNTFLASIVLAVLPVILVVSWYFFKKMQKEFLKADEAEAEMSSSIQENLHGVRVVKAFNRERYELERFETKNSKFRDLSLRVNHQLSYYWSVSDAICYITVLAIIILGINETTAGRLTIGEFFVFVTYISMVLWHVRNFGRALSDMGKVTVAIQRLEEVFAVEEEDMASGDAPAIDGDIVFKDVVFQYDDGTVPVLDGVSFTIGKHETVAIMGPTGSGKSSLMYLLTRLYDYQEGSIMIGEHPLNTLNREHLRANVGIVLQEPFLFSRNILDNIRIAHPQASEDEVFEAARRSEMHHVIDQFDLGYQTLVGEKGVTLSGGQKQRIAIARTVIKSHPILIFDDSLSAVDTQTDQNIRKHLKTLSNATTLIVTHRIASAMDADKIVVLKHGKVEQIGTHEELIKQEGLYQATAKIQNIQWEVDNDATESI